MNAAAPAAKFLKGVFSGTYVTTPEAEAAAAVVVAEVADRVFEDEAPETTPLPYIIFTQRSDNKVQALGETEWNQTTKVYNIKVITREERGYKRADRIANAIFGALSGSEGYIEYEGRNYWVASSYCDSEIRYIENRGAVRFNHVGGAYTVIVNP
jgi:hypothetical protein